MRRGLRTRCFHASVSVVIKAKIKAPGPGALGRPISGMLRHFRRRRVAKTLERKPPLPLVTHELAGYTCDCDHSYQAAKHTRILPRAFCTFSFFAFLEVPYLSSLLPFRTCPLTMVKQKDREIRHVATHPFYISLPPPCMIFPRSLKFENV
jgi:hypothetical protein